jgi:hypothetical protein
MDHGAEPPVKMSSLSLRLFVFRLQYPRTNIAHPNFCFGSQCAFCLPVLHPNFSLIHFNVFFFPHSTTPSATQRITKSNKWSRFLHRCFLGTLMTTDVSGSGIISRVANDQGVWRCPYLTKVRALTLGTHLFARFSLLSLLIDLSFVYHLSFIPLQKRFGPFLIPFPAFLPPRKSSIGGRHLCYPNSILLFV